MASSDISRWCFMHKQPADVCTNQMCKNNAGNPEFTREKLLSTPLQGLPDYSMPESPMSMLTTAATAQKEVYDTYVNVGFGSAQAVYLVAAQLTGSPGIAPGDSDAPLPPDGQ